MGLIRNLVQYGSAQVSAKLGRCSYCMGMSLTGALVGWAALAAAVLNWPQFPFVNILAVVPASFTALWLLHIFTYGGRVVAAQRHTQPEAVPATGSVMTRRRMAAVFATSVGFAALASAGVPLRALGSPPCKDRDKPCASSSVCCPGSICHNGKCVTLCDCKVPSCAYYPCT